MTRDEAIEKVDGLEPFDLPNRRGLNGLLVDKLVALGMLKLDEPLISRSSPMYQLYEALFEHIPTLDFMSFRELIDKSGLKITEK